MSTTTQYTASMITRKLNGTSNYLSRSASQEYYTSGTEFVGVIHFANLSLKNKAIKNMKLTVTSAKAGYGASKQKTVYVCRSNYQEASKTGVTGSDYAGSALGTFDGSFFGNTTTYIFNESTNAQLFNNLAAYFQSGDGTGNNTITLYNPNPPSSTMGYSKNYLQWDAATLEVTYDEGLSEPSVSATSANLGTSIQITVNQLSTSAKHTLEYSFAGNTGNIITEKSSETSISWTPSLNLASSIPNTTSAVCTIICHTYYGETNVGSKSCTITLKVPDNVIPTFPSSTPSISEAVSGISTQFEGYVQTKSKLNVSISVSKAYGSEIKSYKTTLNGFTYTGSSFTTDFLNKSGTNTLTVTVTDSRGRTATKSKTFTVLAYDPPSLSLFTAERCNSDGSAAKVDGNKVRVSLAASVSPVINGDKHNTISCTLRYKKRVDSSYPSTQVVTFTATNYAVNKTNYLLSPSFDVLESYDFKISLKDYFTTVEQTIDVGTKKVIMDFLQGGNGIAFGKIAQNSGYAEFGWPLKLSEPLGVEYGGTGCAGVGALPLSGGTMNSTAQITRDVGSGQWKQTRDKAIIKSTGVPTSNAFSPMLAMKTPSAVWGLGTYNENLYFVRTLDSDYTAGTNKASPTVYINSSGNFPESIERNRDRRRGKWWHWRYDSVGCAQESRY